MVWIINHRERNVGGAIQPPSCLESQGGAKPTYRLVGEAALARAGAGRQVIIAIHGFNVSRPKAVRAYVTLEKELRLSDDQVFFGVAWPGDGWLPVVNYPWEARDAAECGKALAKYLRAAMPDAARFNFISHSLGGRLLLEAVARLGSKAGEVCITAGAVDSNCLANDYAAVKRACERLSVLASRKDKVLRTAYPLGDFLSDVFFGDKDSPWRGALGREGPKPIEAAPVRHRQIPDKPAYDHGDYFPPSDVDGKPGQWNASVAYMRRAMNGEADAWP